MRTIFNRKERAPFGGSSQVSPAREDGPHSPPGRERRSFVLIEPKPEGPSLRIPPKTTCRRSVARRRLLLTSVEEKGRAMKMRKRLFVALFVVIVAAWAAPITAAYAQFITPLKVPANSELCLMHAVAGSKTFVVSGDIAP
jgi:hypothetical protein